MQFLLPDQSIKELTCVNSYKIIENVYKYCPLTATLYTCLAKIVVSRLSTVLYCMVALGVEGIITF